MAWKAYLTLKIPFGEVQARVSVMDMLRTPAAKRLCLRDMEDMEGLFPATPPLPNGSNLNLDGFP